MSRYHSENRESKTKGESSHGKHPAESVKQVEQNHVGSSGKGVSFRLPKDSEVSDHSRVRDLD